MADQKPNKKTSTGSTKKSHPTKIGRYQIERPIGSGGMGTVYLARDTQLDRIIALKVLLRTEHTPNNLIRRFLSEARTAAKLRHPNIVTVYDSGEADGFLFLALEYIEGPDVERWIRMKSQIPVDRTITIAREIAEALTHAHQAGVIHRDIKPSNILIRDDGSATLADLGLARAMDETASSNITRAGFTVGTVDYMPPEQARSSRAADPRSDLYSLGCTLFHMLTGRVPYPEGDLTNKLRAHSVGPPPDPRDIRPDVPEGLSVLIQRLMAQKPEDRHQSASELLADLRRPTLTRPALSLDDLHALADDFEYNNQPSETSAGDSFLYGDMPAGSTIVESSSSPPENIRAPIPPIPTSKPGRVEKKSPAHGRSQNPKEKHRKNTTVRRPMSTTPPSRPSSSIDDRTRTIILWSVLLLLALIALLLFSQIDKFFGPGPLTAPVDPTMP